MLESILALSAIAFLVYFYIHERKLTKHKRKIKDTLEKLPKLVLQEKDLELIKENNIDKDFLYLVSIFFYITDINQLNGDNYNSGKIDAASGIEISIKPVKNSEFIRLRDLILDKPNEYKLFYTEEDFNTNEITKIALIKSTNQFDILQAKYTNAVNYGYDVEDVIDWFENLHKTYPFEILGAGFDWTFIKFSNQIPEENRKSMANKIYKFCPDIVLQGVGKKSELLKLFENDPTYFYFWWD